MSRWCRAQSPRSDRREYRPYSPLRSWPQLGRTYDLHAIVWRIPDLRACDGVGIPSELTPADRPRCPPERQARHECQNQLLPQSPSAASVVAPVPKPSPPLKKTESNRLLRFKTSLRIVVNCQGSLLKRFHK